MPIRWVFFDVGETLVDETRAWTSWAAWLGVPALTFFGVLGAVAWWVVRRGQDTAADYFLAGRNLGWWVIGASISWL